MRSCARYGGCRPFRLGFDLSVLIEEMSLADLYIPNGHPFIVRPYSMELP